MSGLLVLLAVILISQGTITGKREISYYRFFIQTFYDLFFSRSNILNRVFMSEEEHSPQRRSLPPLPRLTIRIQIPDKDESSTSTLNPDDFSPDLQPATPPTISHLAEGPKFDQGNGCYTPSPLSQESPKYSTRKVAEKIGDFILQEQTETVKDFIKVHPACNIKTRQEFVCKVVPKAKSKELIDPYLIVGPHDYINQIEEIIEGDRETFVFFAKGYGDFHSHVRKRRRLREAEAGALFWQVMQVVQHCHEIGLVLRDLKLRKFVFKNPQKTELKLECVEDAYVLGENKADDWLADKHGCPAYVSPEIIASKRSQYSGRCADMWSAGVMLYTMLVGRYPFHDQLPNALFNKIRRGEYIVPNTVSSRGKCLIKSLLRKKPLERLTAEEVLTHPWFKFGSKIYGHNSSAANITANNAMAPALFRPGPTPTQQPLVPLLVKYDKFNIPITGVAAKVEETNEWHDDVDDVWKDPPQHVPPPPMMQTAPDIPDPKDQWVPMKEINAPAIRKCRDHMNRLELFDGGMVL